MNYISDTYFINRLGSHLEGFTVKSPELWNFRCPICGDSKTHEHKKRGYIYKKKGKFFFFCQNCGSPGMTFKNFLKRINPLLFKEYLYNNFTKKEEEIVEVVIPSKKPVFTKQVETERMPNNVREYIKGRKLNVSDFEYTSEFFGYINKLKPGSFDVKRNKGRDHPRLLVKFFNADNKLTIVQGRALNGEEPKYFTIKIDEDADKVYGMDKVDLSKTVYALEGVPDAMCLNNAIATLDMNYLRAADWIPKDKLVIIPDTDVRNKQVMQSVEKCVASGLAVCLLPADGGKDLNEKLINGATRKELYDLVVKHTYSGLTLKMNFSRWRKDK